jgi:FlaA1/EpsC-like NDP-sugar epimerase
MIRLAGYLPDVDIKIVYTGIRKGEKLSEEMFSNKEMFLPTHHQKIFISSEADFSVKIASRIIARLTNIFSYNVTVHKKLLNDVLMEVETYNVEMPVLAIV